MKKTISADEMRDRLIAKLNRILITWIGGNCPIQAEGFVYDVPFYFRARGNHWSMEIGEWSYKEPYGENEFDAGWMTKEEAIEFIEKAVKLYKND